MNISLIYSVYFNNMTPIQKEILRIDSDKDKERIELEHKRAEDSKKVNQVSNIEKVYEYKQDTYTPNIIPSITQKEIK